MPSAERSSTSPVKKSSAAPAAEKKKPVKKDDKPAGADIRGFFSQPPGSSAGSTSARPAPAAKGTGTGKRPITIDDSDDEPTLVASKPSAKASSSKNTDAKPIIPKKTAVSRIIDSESASPPPAKAKAKPAAAPAKAASKPSASASASSSKAKANTPVKRRMTSEDSEDVKPAKRQSLGASKAKAKKPSYQESSDEEEEEAEYKPQKATPASKAGSKGKRGATPMEIDDEDEDDFIEDDEPKKKATKAKAKPAPKKAAAKSDAPKKPAVKKEKKAAKKEDGEDDDKPKKPAFDWRAAAAAKQAGPKNPGSKDIPEGKPGCLQDVAFVFTGELDSLGRDEAIELVKRCSGRVTGAPSGKTKYIVVGENAGASKLKYIEENKEKALNEDQFLELIRSASEGKVKAEDTFTDKEIAAAAKAKVNEEKKIQAQVRELEVREKEAEQLAKRKARAMADAGVAAKKVTSSSSQLWTTRYAPQNVKEICGNKTQVDRILVWLEAWEANFKSGFKKPGKDGMGIYRALLISGPPGIGKTTSAHLMAKMAGYSPIELNASDARSKKLVENSTNIDNTSLDGFFAGKGIGSTMVADVRIGSKTCLIMDEVDGMSAGDRGGVGALNVLIKKTRIPLILICNDRTLQKMKPLQSTTFNMSFRRPQPNEIRSRIMSILFKEKMKVPPNVVDELIKGANSDIRQVLNMLSTFKLAKAEMNFDEGKHLAKVNEKNTILTPFTIIDKLTGPYSFSKTNRESLNDKSDLYFQDFSFVPLFMQEHYLKTNPSAVNGYGEKERDQKHLELVSKAADSISDGDLIDRMIHGSEQHWSLLPVHAIASTVAPAFHVFGTGRNTGGGGWGGPSFPQWLGQNSKQGKLGRQLTDIQIRMRLRVSGGRQEIREQYMPMLASKIVLPLKERGADAIEETIAYMDEYYLGKDDWDAFVELGVGEMNGEAIMKKIATATKSAFTRQYNKADHPIAFHKGDMFAASKKKIADQGPAPDNDEVFEDEVAPEDEPDGKGDSDGENDVTKDKLIKAVKPKGKKADGAAPKKAATKKK
ncbi:purine nucleotide binding protein [Dioszegia hungarica]|uniref:Replication factor C subunit 1 n=1 Tax=Dioszegia hungarica TaxID=4972 RepID=A0AA38LUK4_9TREE|nr:purine nucleotide binding protein [Dioszegia hungarica]KAI9635850.1 purine nucleotide binding protein [Dioszegia hungarica]